MKIRPEKPSDEDPIATLVGEAFAGHPHGAGTEAAIVAALRKADALAIGLVAQHEGGHLAGHVAFSKVRVGGEDLGWYGLGPVAVRPRYQGRGIGAALIRTGLAMLRSKGAAGCVVLGEPDYYARFGFKVDPALRYPGIPEEYFLARAFDPAHGAEGAVTYHAGFTAR